MSMSTRPSHIPLVLLPTLEALAMKPNAVFFALWPLFFPSGALAYPTTHFDQFMPGWNPLVQEVIRDNCSAELAQYKTGTLPPGSSLSAGINPIVNCILEHWPEFRKAEMAASAVVLGLLPTLLSSLGSSPAETAVLSLQRPALAFLLSMGSPAATVMKASDFADAVQALVERGDERMLAFAWMGLAEVAAAGSRWVYLVSAGQYAAVAAAVGNVVYLAYQLGFHAVVAFAPETIFMVPLWTFLCVVIHLLAVLILHLWLRVRGTSATGSRVGSSLRYELCPCAHQPAKKTIAWRGDRGGRRTALPDTLAWLLGVSTIINLIFGTMIFSSLLFFSVRDSLAIAVRYLASTLVCRGVVRMELAGLRGKLVYRDTPRSAARGVDVDVSLPIPAYSTGLGDRTHQVEVEDHQLHPRHSHEGFPANGEHRDGIPLLPYQASLERVDSRP
ncbi:hypothetical protein F4780DRAFT_672666 [Xylariomycetidae sp. FL0641]|nr:hypothetical protein F4780DRAFT_672666 [Xylariomycetidae sp. FL0641]